MNIVCSTAVSSWDFLRFVGINAIFLYAPGAEVYKLLDYSICGYSLTSYILYWSCFNYSTHGNLNKEIIRPVIVQDQMIVIIKQNYSLTYILEYVCL